LFTPEDEPVEIPGVEESDSKGGTEKTEVASYSRSKRGRKPIDSKIPREERTLGNEVSAAYPAKKKSVPAVQN
jgi:hypothetical protein